MKKNFVKYLILLALAIYPCVLFCTACKDDKGTESYISINESIEKSEEIESSSEEIEETSSVEESSIEDSSDTAPEESTDEESTEDSSAEIPEDDDIDTPQDDFPEGGIQGATHHYVTDSALPDCENDGFYKEWCDKCDVVVEEYTIPSLGHEPKEVAGYAPTCKEVGATAYTYCERCEVILIPSEEIPCIPHDFLSGSGSCIWCDASAELQYGLGTKKDEVGNIEYYAICVGVTEFPGYTVSRFLNVPDTVTLEIGNAIYKDLPVKEIAEKAFFEVYDVNTLVIGKNVEKIGERAFDFCENLREVYDKSQLRVGELSKIENGDITKYVKTEDIHYTDDYTSKVSVHEESGCILYSDGDTVELIGIRDTVEHVIIPEGVTTISSYVFYKTRVIKTLSIAKSVTTIMPYAFASRCETHDEKGHSHENCDFPLKTIIFLNAEGWRATSLYGDEPVFFNAIDLTADPMGAWSKLVLSEYAEWQWVSVE